MTLTSFAMVWMIVRSPQTLSSRRAVSNPSQSSVMVIVKFVPVPRSCMAISSPIVVSGCSFNDFMLCVLGLVYVVVLWREIY